MHQDEHQIRMEENQPLAGLARASGKTVDNLLKRRRLKHTLS
jgi:hypothetical protein